MADSKTITVPDIGDFDNVPVIEVLVAEGDEVEAEQSLLTLESDKATLDVPSPHAGKITKILVKEGDDVSEGTEIAQIELGEGEAAEPADDADDDKQDQDDKDEASSDSGLRSESQSKPASDRSAASERQAPAGIEDHDYDYDVVVLGSGPGGYAAAFRAADLGLKVALIERYDTLGGVCLNVGCIPSKALLHTGHIIEEAAALADRGVSFGEPKIELGKLRKFKDATVKKLTDGLAGMAKQREVTQITGTAKFTGEHELEVAGKKKQSVSFARAIIAAGSQAVKLPGLPWDDERLMDSTDALKLEEIPKRLLVIGGGIIGLEMASVYEALGAKVTVVELTDQLMPGADKDLAKIYHKQVKDKYEGIFLGTKVKGAKALKKGIKVEFEGGDAPEHDTFDRVLVAVGRTPNGKAIEASAAGVDVDDRGFISVDEFQRTNVDHIFAIGDIVGQPMLAHKATHEGHVAAEVCAGMKSAFEARVIPSVAYTDPEVAWVGVTEQQAKDDGLDFETAVFPWQASGRALGQGRTEGQTKLIFERESHRLIGAGIIGVHAGDLIAECALAIEMGCDAADIGLTIHPHPTLSESVGLAAEMFEGTITDLYTPKQKKAKKNSG